MLAATRFLLLCAAQPPPPPPTEPPPTSLSRSLPADTTTEHFHGDTDQIFPLQPRTRTHEAVKGSHVVVVEEGGPRGVIWSHAEQVNPGLVNFLE